MVSRFSLLTKSNIAKSKKRIVVVFLLCVLASLLLNIVLILSFNYSNNFYSYKESLNGADISYYYVDYLNNVNENDLTFNIKENDEVSDVEISKVYFTGGESEFGNGSIFKIFSFYSESNYKEKRIDIFEILEMDNSIESGVYLSYLYKAANNYKIGDKIKMILNNKEYEYIIKGFYNSLSTGTANCMDVSFILTEDLYNSLIANLRAAYRVSIVCDNGIDVNDASRKIASHIKEEYPGLYLMHTQAATDTYRTRYSNAQLFQTLLLVSSILIIVILLVMISIVLSNYVKSSISNLGVLKSMGYTSSSLIYPIIIEFGIILTIASIVGIGFSYVVFPLINNALEAQIGIPYFIKFNLINAIITVLVFVILGSITVFLSVLKITHIEPLNAIKDRKVAESLNNIASLDKTKLSLNSAIGIKGCLGKPSRNIIIGICFLMVACLIGFSCFLYANVIKRSDEVIELVCGQFPDCSLSVTLSNNEKVKEDLEKDSNVENYYIYTTKKALPTTGQSISFFLTENNDNLNKDMILIEGRLAENVNEVAINKYYALENNLEIGNNLIFETDERQISYEIVGFTQGAYYAGSDGYMLLDGYERIENVTSYTYYVDLKDGCDIEKWNKEFRVNSCASSIINEYKCFSTTANMYKRMLVVLCIVIVVLSILISSFVLYILISILLENKRREFGIFKSLGFVTKELLYQVILNLLPFAFVATVGGVFLTKKLSDPILSSLLNSMGIFRFGKEISIFNTILCIVLIVGFAVLYTIISSLSIKKITPHELFNKE